MLGYVLKRLGQGMVALLGVSLIVFIVSRLSGDVTYLLLPPNASAQAIRQLHHQLGLDQPLFVQYWEFVTRAVRGDFGLSLQSHTPAMSLVASRLPATLELAGVAFVVSVAVGIPLGVVAAQRPGSMLDRGLSLVSISGQAVPNYWLGMVLILIFAVGLGWFPASGSGGISHLVLPVVALGWYSVALLMRVTRAGIIEVLPADFVRLAHLKGNPPRVVYWKHALKNALGPVLNVAGINFAALIGGAIIIETVFAWPGLGSLMVGAIQNRDYPVIEAGVLLLSAIFIATMLVVDVVHALIDPRVRARQAGG